MNPNTLVAYEMNGEPLPDRHGAPARLIVPGYYGEKNVKWITRVEVVGAEAKGFYEKQGWGPDFTTPTWSRFDEPDDNMRLELGEIAAGFPMKGIAFGGDRGVSKVEVSLDDGKSWQEAKIDYPGTKLTWALWSFHWQPNEARDYPLMVRATDGDGGVQAKDEKRPSTSGITGVQKITVHVEA